MTEEALLELAKRAEEELQAALVHLEEEETEEVRRRVEEAYHLVLHLRDELLLQLGLGEEEALGGAGGPSGPRTTPS